MLKHHRIIFCWLFPGSKRKRRRANREDSSHKQPSSVLSSQVEVPWRLSGGQALTLGETIVGFIPGECFCKMGSKSKWKCLHCCFHEGSGDNPISYLLRPNDADDYQILLNDSFVVVPENAPQLPSDSSSVCRWSQSQVCLCTLDFICVNYFPSALKFWFTFRTPFLYSIRVLVLKHILNMCWV